jgi:hypothetical protein
MYMLWNAVVLGNVPLEAVGAGGLDLPSLFSEGEGLWYHMRWMHTLCCSMGA